MLPKIAGVDQLRGTNCLSTGSCAPVRHSSPGDRTISRGWRGTLPSLVRNAVALGETDFSCFGARGFEDIGGREARIKVLLAGIETPRRRLASAFGFTVRRLHFFLAVVTLAFGTLGITNIVSAVGA